MFRISNELDGVVRCSYLHLYDANKNFLFSIQGSRHNLVGYVPQGTPHIYPVDWKSDASATGEGAFSVDLATQSLSDNGMGDGKIVYSEPVVVATDYMRDQELVPVHLTEKAKQQMLKLMEASIRDYRYRELKTRPEKMKITELEVKFARWLETVIPMVEKNDIFYVKKWQVKWYATNINNSFTELKQAKEKFEGSLRKYKLLMAAAMGSLAV